MNSVLYKTRFLLLFEMLQTVPSQPLHTKSPLLAFTALIQKLLKQRLLYEAHFRHIELGIKSVFASPE